MEIGREPIRPRLELRNRARSQVRILNQKTEEAFRWWRAVRLKPDVELLLNHSGVVEKRISVDIRVHRVVKNSVAAANDRMAPVKRLPGESEPWPEVILFRLRERSRETVFSGDRVERN